MTFFLVIACALLLAASARFVLRGKSQKVVITDPSLGIFDLLPDAGQQYVASDRARLAPIFARVTSDEIRPPKCDVLFIYAELSPDGSFKNGGRDLRDVIRESGAVVAVVASENPPECYTNAAKSTGYGQANLVMTLKRNGIAFEEFFYSLFSNMKRGVSMPVAWVELAPHNPSAEHAGLPATIFACEKGQVTFT